MAGPYFPAFPPQGQGSGGGGGGTGNDPRIRIISKSIDQQVVSSTVKVNDNDFTFPVKANTKYIFIRYYLLDSPTAADFDHLYSLPTGTSGGNIDGIWDADTQTPVSDVTVNRRIDTNDGLIRPSLGAGEFTTGGTAGNFLLQWAQSSSNPTPTILKAGSFVLLIEVA